MTQPTNSSPHIQWCGDENNGIRISWQPSGALDEICLFVNGKCVAQLETMSDTSIFAWFQVQDHEVTANLCAEDYAVSDLYEEDVVAKLAFKIQEVNQLQGGEWINKKS